uniref:Peptidase A2 domain-containing protein n=1 Tax=Romanomermis culicivorax TaxID=13658 RepID=A0A915I2H4_ROMCU
MNPVTGRLFWLTLYDKNQITPQKDRKLQAKEKMKQWQWYLVVYYLGYSVKFTINFTAPNQNIPRLIGGKKRPITQSELEMANKYPNVDPITIPVQIFGHTMLAIIDTGDTYSTIFQRPAEDILHRPIHSFQLVGGSKAAGGSMVPEFGPIFANATTPFGPILLPLTLTPEMEPGGIEVLLGLDFLFHPAIEAIMDFGTSTLSIQGKTISMGKVVPPSTNGPEAGYRTM